MRVRIHRGAHEIGGSCVEVESAGERIVLDVGRPLDAGRKHVPLSSAVDDGVSAVLISHYHQDHWGLVGQVPKSVPIYIGKAADAILREASFWTEQPWVEAAGFFRSRHPRQIGPFRVTPFLNDHSAFDAYSFLIEAGGRRLFYTGDIRGHGRKGRAFEYLLKRPPVGVHVLLMEGTNIFPKIEGAPGKSVITEAQVEKDVVATIEAATGVVLVRGSAQNIDRLVTVYRAATRCGRTLVMDLYGSNVARATGNGNIPSPWSTHRVPVRVFVPKSQQVRVAKTKQFWRVKELGKRRIYEEGIARHPERFVVLSSFETTFQLDKALALEGASAIWSNWSGYLDEEAGKKWAAFMDKRGIPWVVHHASGHASVPDLQRLDKALKPGRIVPIHTSSSLSYPELFDNVEVQRDRAWWEV
jgi:ribonuclease J